MNLRQALARRETNVVKLDLFSATSWEDSGYMIDKALF